MVRECSLSWSNASSFCCGVMRLDGSKSGLTTTLPLISSPGITPMPLQNRSNRGVILSGSCIERNCEIRDSSIRRIFETRDARKPRSFSLSCSAVNFTGFALGDISKYARKRLTVMTHPLAGAIVRERQIFIIATTEPTTQPKLDGIIAIPKRLQRNELRWAAGPDSMAGTSGTPCRPSESTVHAFRFQDQPRRVLE